MHLARVVSRSLSTFVMAVALATPLLAQRSNPSSAQQGTQGLATSAVNLNTATAAQLESLPGIGPATARRIIEHREGNGDFKKIEELMNVQGIGEKTFLNLKALITVGAPRTEAAGQRTGR